MEADSYQEKLQALKSAVSQMKKVKIWVSGTPENSGHVLSPYAILEDALMLDFVFAYNEDQNRMVLTGVNGIVKLELTDIAFPKPENWSKEVDTSKFKIVAQ